jgi:DNA repair exonuclease SbcCD ATPase subunit
MCLKKYRKIINNNLADLRSVRAGINDTRVQLAEHEDALFNAEEAATVIHNVSKAMQEQAHTQIAKVVSRCLSMVFEDPYEFNIIFEQKRGRTEARLVFSRNGVDVDPLGAAGGGVVDVAAFALRLSCLLLARPQRRRLVILDEPFKFVSEEYREQIRLMLEGLADELDMQFVMVTHVDELRTGKVIEIK